VAGAVLFYGGLAAEVLLFAGIGEQLVARLAARSRLVATIGNLNVATSGDLLTALDSGVARPLIESRTALAATAATAVSSTDMTGHAGNSSGSTPQATRWRPAWRCSSRPASRGAPLAAAGCIVAATVTSGNSQAQPSSVGSGPARPQPVRARRDQDAQATGLHRVAALVDCYGIDLPDGRRHRAADQPTFLTVDGEAVSGV